MAKKIDVGGMLNAATVEGKLADASQVYDSKKGKSQEKFNEEIEAKVESYKQELEQDVTDAVANLVGGASETFDTLKEFEDWINNDKSGAAAIAKQTNENKNDISDLNANTGISEYPAFDPAEAYAVGDVVKYEGQLKRFTEEHAAGEWIGTDVEEWSERKEREGKVAELGQYVENSEYARAYTDAKGRFLWGIKQDGSVEFAKGVPTPIKNYIVEFVINRIDNVIVPEIETLKEAHEQYLKESENPEWARVIVDAEGKVLWGIRQDGSVEFTKGVPTSIKAYIDSLDRNNDEEVERINQLVIGLLADVKVLTDTYHYVSNTEWACAILDSEERILMGIKADGSYYIPNRDMYHIVSNSEYSKAVVDSDGRILFGIKNDGTCYIPKGISEDAKKGLVELTCRIAVFEELFGVLESFEWVKVTVDSNGRILEGIGNDGKKYLPKQEMLEKIQDSECRTEITLDTEGRIVSYRDSDGVKNESRQYTREASFGKLVLTESNGQDIAETLRKVGFNVKNIFDWSDSEFVEIPIPDVCAVVNILVDSQAKSKTDDIETFIEFWDKNGNYFKKPIVLNAQGSSSMTYWIKNQAIDLADGSKIKLGNWVAQDSFHLKKFYIDVFRGQANVGYWLTEQVYQSRDFGERKPFEYLFDSTTAENGEGKFKEDFSTGALCHPDGFPFLLHFNGKLAGVYSWNLKKHRDNYWMKKDNPKQIILDGMLGTAELFNGKVDWTAFEIRNPKDLIDIDGNEYDGDKPTELSDTDELSSEVKSYIERLSTANAVIKANKTKETFEQFFLVNPFIDYWLISQVLWNQDGFWKNWIWCTWDGMKWTPTSYDMDSIFGMFYQGTYIVPAGEYVPIGNSVTAWTNTNTILGYVHVAKHLYDLYKTEIENRYKELRDSGVFTTDNIVSLLDKWVKKVGYDNLKTDIEECCSYDGVPQTPSYRDGTLTYSQYPNSLGFYNSVLRVKKWLDNHFEYLDSMFNFNV